MSFITEAAMDMELNSYVYVTYRHLLVALLIWPFAYYFEKGLRPKMTFMLFLEIFVLSLLGVSLGPNLYFASLEYTSPTFVTSMVNTVPSITFVIAIILRMEIVDAKSLRGMVKIAGTVVSLAGATTMTLYKGEAITSHWKPPIHMPGSSVVRQSWWRGPILALASCLCWSIWFILQASSIKRYPAHCSLTAWMCTVGGIQSAVFAVLMQHKRQDWMIGFLGLKFWCVVYSGIACSGFTFYVQLWCTQRKGPVFVTMFDPLAAIMAAMLAYFMFGENLYIGSIIGGAVVILGLYMLLWGKGKDQIDKSSTEHQSERDGDQSEASSAGP
ncbi:hypothetical protein SORBI_3001G494700 [Sorghum bicolor]|uniref:WAT1-related protein n=3 Tax=Sorghum bicolor TaxID=4558 RepID=A0A1B6QQC3_SORBI|nr:hypothetical protein SORBI_3001G494700 [Sorghum bicolor]